MKKYNTIKLITHLGMVVALATAVAGCASSDNYKQASKTSTSLQEAADKIAVGNAKIDTTLGSLNDLVNNPQGDMVGKFNRYSACVDDLQSSSQQINNSVSDMKADSDSYFKNWDDQLATINNEDIKNRSEQRKQDVESKFSNIKQGYSETQKAFQPFMSDLKDIQTALRTDLTTGGISSVQSAAAKANADGATLKSSMGRLADQFRSLGVSMAPPPTPTTAQ
jgi:uncharacterized protein (DUF3084 family)